MLSKEMLHYRHLLRIVHLMTACGFDVMVIFLLTASAQWCMGALVLEKHRRSQVTVRTKNRITWKEDFIAPNKITITTDYCEELWVVDVYFIEDNMI